MNFPMDFWLFWICYINFICTNIYFIKYCFIGDLLWKPISGVFDASHCIASASCINYSLPPKSIGYKFRQNDLCDFHFRFILLRRISLILPLLFNIQHGLWHLGDIIQCTTKYIPRVPQCPLVRIETPHPLSRKRVCPPPSESKGGHTRLRLKGWGVRIRMTGEKA